MNVRNMAMSSSSPATPPVKGFGAPRVPPTSFDIQEALRSKEKWQPALTREQVAFCKDAIVQLKEKTKLVGGRMPVDDEFDYLREDKLRFLQADVKVQAARLAKNHQKNRYSNVLPFDETRVKLSSANGDYINASFIMDAVHENLPVFIATQGPLRSTTVDFWQMILQQKCPVIVMLTKLVDDNQERCAHYYPALLNQSQLFGQLRVTNKEMSYLQDQRTLQRIIEVENVKDSSAGLHSLIHLEFRDWPDFDVPSSTTGVRDIVRTLQCVPADAGPFVVHCSAGVGRTGTFCAIDHSIRRVLAEDPSALSVDQTVRHFRLQRNRMIETKDQYRFVYQTVIDELEDLVNAVESQD